MLSDNELEDHFTPSVRLIELARSDTTCGFHLTRGKWDPYPWVSKIDEGSMADEAGMKPGDCLLEVNGDDVVGKRITDIAQIVKSQPQVSLLLWNAGANVQCSPETLCCGPMPNNFQRLTACTSSILNFLECPICLDTTQPPIYQCDNGHIICMRCRAKSERCPVCRIRYTCGRSIFADNVYNAIMDAFELRHMSHEVRCAKMNQIFKPKDKKAAVKSINNLPDIKVTHAHANKFLARLIGKASSVENLSSKSPRSNHLMVDNEFATTLKTKSLSSNEIFNPVSPAISRTNSINGMSQFNCARCSSVDSLEPRDKDNGIVDDGVLYHCPYSAECTILLKASDIIHHFQSTHDGPLIQYFKPKLTIKLCDNQTTYLVIFEDKYFVLKIIQEQNESIIEYRNLRIWVWLIGNKKLASEYQLHVNIFNKSSNLDNAILSTRSPTYPLNSVSWVDIKESKKAIFLNAITIQAVSATEVFVECEIFKCENNGNI